MPRNRNNSKSPPVMTWPKAMPVLAIAVMFDLVRMFFEWFWFFGPAVAAMACTAGVNTAIGTSVTGVIGKVVAGTCTGAAAVLGMYGVAMTGTFGSIMAMAVGLFGWMTIGLILTIFNKRVFKENALWFVASLGIAELPFIGTIPSFTFAMWRMYHSQIKREKKAFAQYEQSQAATQIQGQQQQMAEFMQAQTAELAPVDV